MTKFLHSIFHGSIRLGAFGKATLLQNLFTVLSISVSVLWLLGCGMDLIFANATSSYLKTVIVVIGYGVPITIICTMITYDYEGEFVFTDVFASRGD